MRKIYLLISVTFLLLVGCSNETLHFKGESVHWRGKYTTNIDGNREMVCLSFVSKMEFK